MLHTYEAYYENGKLTFFNPNVVLKKAKVLVTIIEEETEIEWPIFSRDDFAKFRNSIKLSISPLEFQKKIRDEW